MSALKKFKSFCLVKNSNCDSLSKPQYILQLNHGKNLKVNNINKPFTISSLLPQNENQTKSSNVSQFPTSITNVQRENWQEKEKIWQEKDQKNLSNGRTQMPHQETEKPKVVNFESTHPNQANVSSTFADPSFENSHISIAPPQENISQSLATQSSNSVIAPSSELSNTNVSSQVKKTPTKNLSNSSVKQKSPSILLSNLEKKISENPKEFSNNGILNKNKQLEKLNSIVQSSTSDKDTENANDDFPMESVMNNSTEKTLIDENPNSSVQSLIQTYENQNLPKQSTPLKNYSISNNSIVNPNVGKINVSKTSDTSSSMSELNDSTNSTVSSFNPQSHMQSTKIDDSVFLPNLASTKINQSSDIQRKKNLTIPNDVEISNMEVDGNNTLDNTVIDNRNNVDVRDAPTVKMKITPNSQIAQNALDFLKIKPIPLPTINESTKLNPSNSSLSSHTVATRNEPTSVGSITTRTLPSTVHTIATEDVPSTVHTIATEDVPSTAHTIATEDIPSTVHTIATEDVPSFSEASNITVVPTNANSEVNNSTLVPLEKSPSFYTVDTMDVPTRFLNPEKTISEASNSTLNPAQNKSESIYTVNTTDIPSRLLKSSQSVPTLTLNDSEIPIEGSTMSLPDSNFSDTVFSSVENRPKQIQNEINDLKTLQAVKRFSKSKKRPSVDDYDPDEIGTNVSERPKKNFLTSYKPDKSIDLTHNRNVIQQTEYDEKNISDSAKKILDDLKKFQVNKLSTPKLDETVKWTQARK